jgi:hypothetical protein
MNAALHVVMVWKYGGVRVTILLRRMEEKIALCWEMLLNIEFVENSFVHVRLCMSSFLCLGTLVHTAYLYHFS